MFPRPFSTLDLEDFLVLLTDLKYHIVKQILVRTVYNSYLRDKTLIGENMLNTYTEACRVILVNRGIYLENEAQADWLSHIEKNYSKNAKVQKLFQ